MRPHLACTRGQTVVIVALLAVPVLLGGAALAIDLGMALRERVKLAAVADAAALAAAQELPDATLTAQVAVDYADQNHPGHGQLIDPSEVVLGHWDYDIHTFTPGGAPINGVDLWVRRTEARGNALATLFARVFGQEWMNVAARATAAVGNNDDFFRFLIDDEMFDSDIPAIEELAADYGMGSEEIISDGDGDWFVDMPAGEILELPTGQLGDEALFDITHSAFPFSSQDRITDFLNYNEDGSWREDLLEDADLDPLEGVETVSDPSRYPEFVTSACQVSPLYKSDVSTLDPVAGNPAVNAKGERRGLVRFKILGVGSDPDGSGSQLPNLVIETCPPLDDESLSTVPRGTNGEKIQLVR